LKHRIAFITGTDTGVGKTVFACLLVRHLLRSRIRVVALKPISSGGRADAIALHLAQNETLPLDAVNPWHFCAPISPTAAARLEKRFVTLEQVVRHVRRFSRSLPLTLIEGAGGLLSPLGRNFDSRDLIRRLRATPVVVGLNQLGVINQMRLTLEALPPSVADRAQVVLMSPRIPDASTASNAQWLSRLVRRNRIHVLPRLPAALRLDPALRDLRVARTLGAIARALLE